MLPKLQESQPYNEMVWSSNLIQVYTDLNKYAQLQSNPCIDFFACMSDGDCCFAEYIDLIVG